VYSIHLCNLAPVITFKTKVMEIKNSPKTVKAPANNCNPHLTTGKIYEIECLVYPMGFEIINDRGFISFCLFEGCGHLNNGDWIIESYE